MKNTSGSLFLMAKKEKYLLTVSVSLKDLAEFSAATDILGQRTNTAFVYQFMMQKVREAKGSVTEKEFNNAVEEKMQEITARSKQKSLERKRSLENSNGTEPTPKSKLRRQKMVQASSGGKANAEKPKVRRKTGT